MGMQERLEQLKQLREQIHAGGGPKRIEKQHEAGKRTARERIEMFFDPGTFVEINTFAGDPDISNLKNPGEGVVTGYGKVDGVRCTSLPRTLQWREVPWGAFMPPRSATCWIWP